MHKLNTTFFIYSIFYFNNYAFQMNPYPNWAGWFLKQAIIPELAGFLAKPVVLNQLLRPKQSYRLLNQASYLASRPTIQHQPDPPPDVRSTSRSGGGPY